MVAGARLVGFFDAFTYMYVQPLFEKNNSTAVMFATNLIFSKSSSRIYFIQIILVHSTNYNRTGQPDPSQNWSEVYNI